MAESQYPQILPADYVRIGYIRRPHALSGEMVADLDVDLSNLPDTEDAAFVMLNLVGLLVPFRILSYRERTDGKALIRLSGINGKDEVLKLQGADLFIHRSYLDDAEDESMGRYIGYELLNEDGKVLGTITHVDETTMNTLIEVSCENKTPLLFPAPPELIRSIDPDNRRFVLSIPDGLTDL